MKSSGLKTLTWLILLSSKNRFLRQLSQLKKPRYAIAFLLGIGYLGLILLPMLLAGSDADSSKIESGLNTFGIIVPLLIMALISASWIWGGQQNALALTPAETTMLVPAPLTRRQLIQYKLIQSQVGIITTATILSIVFSSETLPWILRLTSFWILFTTMYLHQIAASLVHAGAFGHGGPGFRRFIVPAVFAVMALIVILMCFQGVMSLFNSGDFRGGANLFIDNLSGPVPRLVMFPVTAILDPLSADNFSTWLTAVPAALVVLFLHYLWVQHSKHAFEEAAAEAGRLRMKMMEAMSTGQISVINRPGKIPFWRRRFRLNSTGNPATAIIWKNLLVFFGQIRPTLNIVILICLVLFTAGLWFATSREFAAEILSMVLFSCIILVTLFGPLSIRADLRLDLASIELLRTFPLSGRSLVSAEIIASAIALSLLQSMLIILTLVCRTAGIASPEALALSLKLGVMGLILSFPFNLLQYGIQNAIALIWPAWSQFGKSPANGIENMGKMMVIMLVTIFATLVVLIIPAFTGAIAYALSSGSGVTAVIITGAGAAIGAVFEFYLFCYWLGKMYDDMDPVEVGLLK